MSKEKRHKGPIEGWHFITPDFKLAYNDGRFAQRNRWLKARLADEHWSYTKGKYVKIEQKPLLCRRGMHMSRGICQAAHFAGSSRTMLCRVEIKGAIQWGKDKLVGKKRRILWWIPAEDLFRDYLELIGKPFKFNSSHLRHEFAQMRHAVVSSIDWEVGKKRKFRQDLLRRLAWKHAREQWEFEEE